MATIFLSDAEQELVRLADQLHRTTVEASQKVFNTRLGKVRQAHGIEEGVVARFHEDGTGSIVIELDEPVVTGPKLVE